MAEETYNWPAGARPIAHTPRKKFVRRNGQAMAREVRGLKDKEPRITIKVAD
jgi:hypothetical protein